MRGSGKASVHAAAPAARLAGTKANSIEGGTRGDCSASSPTHPRSAGGLETTVMAVLTRHPRFFAVKQERGMPGIADKFT